MTKLEYLQGYSLRYGLNLTIEDLPFGKLAFQPTPELQASVHSLIATWPEGDKLNKNYDCRQLSELLYLALHGWPDWTPTKLVSNPNFADFVQAVNKKWYDRERVVQQTDLSKFQWAITTCEDMGFVDLCVHLLGKYSKYPVGQILAPCWGWRGKRVSSYLGIPVRYIDNAPQSNCRTRGFYRPNYIDENHACLLFSGLSSYPTIVIDSDFFVPPNVDSLIVNNRNSFCESYILKAFTDDDPYWFHLYKMAFYPSKSVIDRQCGHVFNATISRRKILMASHSRSPLDVSLIDFLKQIFEKLAKTLRVPLTEEFFEEYCQFFNAHQYFKQYIVRHKKEILESATMGT